MPSALLASRASALNRGLPMCDASRAIVGRPAKAEALLPNAEALLPICCCEGVAASVPPSCRGAEGSKRRL